MTAEEFEKLGDIGRAELVRGRVIYLVKPKPRHGRIAMRISAPLAEFVHRHNLGEVYAAETGFIAGRDPDSVRAPDVAFVRAEVVAAHDEEEWLPHSPDLAVEVMSPSDRPGAVQDKVRMWLDGGARSVWVIDPDRRLATIYRADGSEQVINEDDDLRDDSVLPGFSMSLRRALDRSAP